LLELLNQLYVVIEHLMHGFERQLYYVLDVRPLMLLLKQLIIKKESVYT